MGKTAMFDAKEGARLLDDAELDRVGGGIRDEVNFIQDEENFIGDEENFSKPDVTKSALGRIARGA